MQNFSFKKLFCHWHMWVCALVLIIILFRGISGIESILFYAMILICPLMMLFTMRGGDHYGKKGGDKHGK